MCQHNLPCFIVYAHCLLPGRAFASLYVLLFLEKEAEIGGHDNCSEHTDYTRSLTKKIHIQYKYCNSLFMHKGQDQVNFVEVYNVVFNATA